MKLAKILNLLGIKLNIYRVGDIILTTNSTNPKYDYGGTWELWGAGRVPVGVDTSQNEFSQIEKTGGEKTVTLTNNNLPAGTVVNDTGNIHIGTESGTVLSKTTAATPINNLQPYITCYMWKKIA